MSGAARRLPARGEPGRRPAAAAEAPLNREAWIRTAITMMAENSVDALRIDELATRLGVTKGSFYWHFPNRESLLDAVLETWRTRMTSDIRAYIERVSGEPDARLRKLLRTALRPRPDVPGGPLELTLRDWARRDPKVARVVSEVDAERLAFVAQLYRDAGQDAAQADRTALAHLALTIGLRMLPFDGTREDMERRWALAEELLVTNSGGTGR